MDGLYITSVEAKAHLRVDFTDDDTYIDSLIALVEELVLVEIQGSILGEGIVTTAGTTALVGSESNFTDYALGDTITVAGETTRIIATITDDTHLTVTSAFSTSVSALTYIMHGGMPLIDGDIPKGLKQAMLLILGHFYNNRESTVMGVTVTEIPLGYKYLISPYKNYTIA
jgi:hypothetical protein